MPKRVSAVLGKNVTLECRVEVGTNLTLTQSSWERRLPSGSVTVAVYNPEFGTSIPPEFIHRLYFRSPSSHDATIVLENVGFSDVGIYTCKVATFPLGNTQASTTVNVLGKCVSLFYVLFLRKQWLSFRWFLVEIKLLDQLFCFCVSVQIFLGRVCFLFLNIYALLC